MASMNIWTASADNKIEIVKNLIESGSFTANSPDPNGYTPIHACASYSNIDLLKYLISKGGNINIQDSDGDTPLHHVEDLNTAKILIKEFSANYKIKNNDGLTPGQYQEEEGEFPELTKYLLNLEKYGDDVTDGSKVIEEELLSLPNGEQIQYILSNEPDDSLLDDDIKEKRKQLEKIFTESNSEEEKNAKLREYVMGVVADNIQDLRDGEDEQDSKRRR